MNHYIPGLLPDWVGQRDMDSIRHSPTYIDVVDSFEAPSKTGKDELMQDTP